MRRELALIAVAVAACGGPRFLGARIGDRCETQPRCIAWATERAIRVNTPVVSDPALVRYVTGIVARLVERNGLRVRPRVVIVDGSESAAFAIPPDLVGFDRRILARLDSEDEVAAILAHELVHLEAGHVGWLGEEDDDVGMRDRESVADERAVALLRGAGYAPIAMLSMLEAVSRDDWGNDPSHPPWVHRLARAAVLVADAPGTPRHEPHRGIVGGRVVEHVRLLDDGARLITPYIVLDKPRDLERRTAFAAWTVGPAVGDLLVDRLLERRERRVAGLRVVIGRMSQPPAGVRTAVEAQLERVIARWLAPPEQTVIVVRGPRDLVLELDAPHIGRWTELLLAGLRAPTAAERARIQPLRLRYVPAASSGPYGEVARRTCAHVIPHADDPERLVTRGEPIRCGTRD